MFFHWKNQKQKFCKIIELEYIPVGYLPIAAVTAGGRGLCPEGTPNPLTEWLTHASENITFPCRR